MQARKAPNQAIDEEEHDTQDSRTTEQPPRDHTPTGRRSLRGLESGVSEGLLPSSVDGPSAQVEGGLNS